MADYFDACPYCGFDQREGVHGLMTDEDDTHVLLVCQVPVEAQPLAQTRVDIVTDTRAMVAMKES